MNIKMSNINKKVFFLPLLLAYVYPLVSFACVDSNPTLGDKIYSALTAIALPSMSVILAAIVAILIIKPKRKWLILGILLVIMIILVVLLIHYIYTATLCR